MATWIEDFNTWLATNDFGVEGVDLFIGDLPDPADYPNAVMSCKPYQGRDGTTAVDPPIMVMDFPRIQMYFRDQQYEYLAPYARAMTLYDFLKNAYGVVTGDSLFHAFKVGMPFSLGGQDGTGRYTITMRVEVTRNSP